MSVIRCAACTKRIRSHHPRIGLIDLETRGEFSYHARCQEHAALDMAASLKRGKAYMLRHYHGSACPDETPGFGCSGGCFDTPVAAVAN